MYIPHTHHLPQPINILSMCALPCAAPCFYLPTTTSQVKDVPATIKGAAGLYSRADLFQAEICWCIEKKQRVSEYDAIYYKLNQHYLDLTATLKRPITMLEAAQDLAAAKGVCRKGKGGISMYKFMKECEVFRKEHKEAQEKARKAAETAAAQEGEGEGEGGQEEEQE